MRIRRRPFLCVGIRSGLDAETDWRDTGGDISSLQIIATTSYELHRCLSHRLTSNREQYPKCIEHYTRQALQALFVLAGTIRTHTISLPPYRSVHISVAFKKFVTHIWSTLVGGLAKGLAGEDEEWFDPVCPKNGSLLLLATAVILGECFSEEERNCGPHAPLAESGDLYPASTSLPASRYVRSRCAAGPAILYGEQLAAI
ncbi:uncharacterized protein BT62DRAFT_1008624 [Guyanagaster necrorhizus]|uniref:Uncharacterized protein n=1 Tax=Guyanagaster necrorhizus TaxID=856835 RepID=A0A9P7VQ12_9AGAR|nr:uncharacterized protein BT62DRAFT_1008624 [Guyanagaster necrorhizus MCA 3950]KAG7443936.1 hypothetical protein BT62DRAFT_1008624 [Guyanagaster necrorhizus MCA 3950]